MADQPKVDNQLLCLILLLSCDDVDSPQQASREFSVALYDEFPNIVLKLIKRILLKIFDYLFDYLFLIVFTDFFEEIKIITLKEQPDV